MDIDLIRELLKVVAESGVAEIEIKEDDFKLVVRKNTPTVVYQAPLMPAVDASYLLQGNPVPSESPPLPDDVKLPSGAPTSFDEPVGTGGHVPATGQSGDYKVEVRAPLVGTFYRASALDADPFVREGDEVTQGDVLCVIEAMKLMNEIECEVTGTVKRILVDNAQPVEYDQPLFVIEQ